MKQAKHKQVTVKKAEGAAKKIGRPLLYSAAVDEDICRCLIEGMSLRQICALEGMPSFSAVRRWLADSHERMDAFRAHYARARELQAETYADQIIQIADDMTRDVAGELQIPNAVAVQRAKLQIDARKWIAAKLLPKKYGDKVDVAHSGAISTVILPPAPVAGSTPPPLPPQAPSWADQG